MKTILAAILCLPIVALGQFQTNTTSKTINIDNLGENRTDFNITWRAFEDQSVTLTISNTTGYLDMTGCYAIIMGKMSEKSITNVFTIGVSESVVSVSNVTWSMTKAEVNALPNGVYDTDVILTDSVTTNVVRYLARGKTRIVDSLFDD